jgi:hypothetical protein
MKTEKTINMPLIAGPIVTPYLLKQAILQLKDNQGFANECVIFLDDSIRFLLLEIRVLKEEFENLSISEKQELKEQIGARTIRVSVEISSDCVRKDIVLANLATN